MKNAAGTVAAMCLVLCATAAWAPGEAPVGESQSRQILDGAGVRGGLVVHVGCGDGTVTAALRANDSYLVHGLDADAANVAKSRAHIRSLNLYGPVSVEQWAGGRLPYAENMVNLLVDQSGKVSQDEAMRVLAPLGVAMIGGKKVVKPWPKEIDEWTHWFHGPDNNWVSRDTRVGPPERMQWVADPLWGRSHEVVTTVAGAVTAGGRMFYCVDEGQTGINSLPSKWMLVARDAFNGVLLWKMPLPDWGAAGAAPKTIRPRTVVTDGERVYLAAGKDAALTALDAATGKILKDVPEARDLAAIVCGEGVLIALAGKNTLIAARPDTLEVLWRASGLSLHSDTLAIHAGRVLFHDGAGVVALDAKTGNEAWRTGGAGLGKNGKPALTGMGGRLIADDGKVFAPLDKNQLVALDVASGKEIWRGSYGIGDYVHAMFFAADGQVWIGKNGASLTVLDAATGEVRKKVDASNVHSLGHHYRCYPPKATVRYSIDAYRGAEFISLTSDNHVKNDWLRGNCAHGLVPANGLLYVPPSQCSCYPGVMMTGFKVLAPGPVATPGDPREDATRLQPGPAYADVQQATGAPPSVEDWPMHRHDASRLGATPTDVSANVRPVWQATIGGRLTQPVVAGRTALVAACDTYTLHALDARDGKSLWTFVAGGRIDSAPTVHKDLVLFGSADGWIYCLRLADGELAWRFRGAPDDRRIGAFGRLESAWPVSGSVIVLDDVVYFAAGRHTYVDGGIFAFGLDYRSGRVLHYNQLEKQALPPGETDSANQLYVAAYHTEGARADLLVTDGRFLYLGPLKLDAKLVRQPTPYVTPTPTKARTLDLAAEGFVDGDVFKQTGQKGILGGGVSKMLGDKDMGLRMVSTSGFLDDTWFNRTFWMYAKVWPGYYFAHVAAKSGQLLVVDADTTYGVQAFPSRIHLSPAFKPGTMGYLLFADANDNEPLLDDSMRGKDKALGYTRNASPKWFQWVPVRIRAMVKAGDTLFLAGPPDVMDRKDPYAAFEGRLGATLWAVSAADGKKLSEQTLDAPPVFDGMSCANGWLYVSTTDGRVHCFGKGQ